MDNVELSKYLHYSEMQFRHLANKVGNLERPFLKEFFPRWVGSCGCPALKYGLYVNISLIDVWTLHLLFAYILSWDFNYKDGVLL